MTKVESNVRLALYVIGAMLVTASGSMQSVDFSDAKQLTGWALAVITSGVIALRAYIDKTPAQIDKP